MCAHRLTPEADESQAREELYRSEWGCLPDQHRVPRSISVPSAMEKLAKKLDPDILTDTPVPSRIASVLRYAAKLLRYKQDVYDRAIDDALRACSDALVDPPTHQQDELMDNIVGRLRQLKADNTLSGFLKKLTKHE